MPRLICWTKTIFNMAKTIPGVTPKPQEQKTVTFHTTPDMVVLYTRKWAAEIKKTRTPAEAAIAEDILTMVQIGYSCLEPAAPAEPGKTK